VVKQDTIKSASNPLASFWCKTRRPSAEAS
jgi:hypothetical protein